MGPITMIATYFIVWWTVLFAVLPLGMNQSGQTRPTDGADWGAPDKPNLKRKFITTTWVAAIIWLIIIGVVHFQLIPLPEFDTPTY